MTRPQWEVFRENQQASVSNKIDFAIFSAMHEELDFFYQLFSTCDFYIAKADNFEFNVYIYKNK